MPFWQRKKPTVERFYEPKPNLHRKTDESGKSHILIGRIMFPPLCEGEQNRTRAETILNLATDTGSIFLLTNEQLVFLAQSHFKEVISHVTMASAVIEGKLYSVLSAYVLAEEKPDE